MAEISRGEIENLVLEVVKQDYDNRKEKKGEINLENTLVGDLGNDSLDVVEMTMALEENFSKYGLNEINDEELIKYASEVRKTNNPVDSGSIKLGEITGYIDSKINKKY